MKLVFIQFRDPCLWSTPTVVYYEEDLERFKPLIISTGGILLRETDSILILGTVTRGEDNRSVEELGMDCPQYRDIGVYEKSQIVFRKDFEIKLEGETE